MINNYQNRAVSTSFLVMRFIFLVSVVLFVLYLLFSNRQVKFESPDRYFSRTVPCDINGFCYGGELFCKDGYVRKRNICVVDPKKKEREYRIQQIIELIKSTTPSFFNCDESYHWSQKEIADYFNIPHSEISSYMDAVIHTKDIRSDSDERYFTYNVSMSLRCDIIRSINENYSLVALFLINIILLCVIVLIYLHKKHVARSAKDYSEVIISQLGYRDNMYHSIKDFEPIPKDPLHKHWNNIVKIVEQNPHVYSIQTESGKKWKYN